MITVAKGGGGDASVDDFCYRYPEHKDCTGIDFLPMLLVLPRYNDYMDGSVLLGLGDIVCKCHYLVKSNVQISSCQMLIVFLLYSFRFKCPDISSPFVPGWTKPS